MYWNHIEYFNERLLAWRMQGCPAGNSGHVALLVIVRIEFIRAIGT
jgi:hypothetical protein